MKSNQSYKVFAIILLFPLIALFFGGCSKNETKRKVKVHPNIGSHSSEKSGNSAASANAAEGTTTSYDANEQTAPSGEPTFIVGLDGKPIYTSEVTKVYDSRKEPTSIDQINPDNDGVTVICDGFQFFKEPEGTAYNNYKNPEMFKKMEFVGKTPQNNNKWRRVKVGDEICGLKLVNSTTRYDVSRYYDDGYYYTQSGLDRPTAEFEGTVTIEGFMSSSSRNPYEPNGGTLRFTPTENKLPLMGNELDIEPRFGIATAYDTNDLLCFNEIGLVSIDAVKCDITGLGVGDIAYVRATLGNIKYRAGYMVADLDEMELLSDVIVHIDDTV